MQSLAVRYRPATFSDVTEQGSVKLILQEQLATKTFKNGYLFTGGAGTGKTTCARIFGREINNNKGSIVELDAASNNSVDDVRGIIENSKFKALDAPFKVYIIDECHMFTTAAWNAMLKLLEEPPAATMFILCTTDPQKIPVTILSRVQRYDFKRISFKGVVERLTYILDCENGSIPDSCQFTFTKAFAKTFKKGEVCSCEAVMEDSVKKYVINSASAFTYEELIKVGSFSGFVVKYEKAALEYIAKIANGGMRDAITLLDKCVSYSKDITVENVVAALGTVNYSEMVKLTNAVLDMDSKLAIEIIEECYRSGSDIKQFIKQYMQFILDACKYDIMNSFEYLQIPSTLEEDFKEWGSEDYDFLQDFLKGLVNLNSAIKWETSPLTVIECFLLMQCAEE